MTLQELKSSIEDGTFKPTPLVLISEDKFIPLQYISAMSKILGHQITYLDTLEEMCPNEDDIFSSLEDTISSDIVVFNTDIVDFCDEVVFNNNVIVVANKIDTTSKKFYSGILIEIPKLSEWQIKDMVYSFCRGVDKNLLDWLIHNCNWDVNRLYQECSKINVFEERHRKDLFLEMSEDGTFDDMTASTIFNFTNAIMKKDLVALKAIYEEIDNVDINEFGLLTILYNNFFNIVNIQLGINPTAESLGMKPNQFNAIKRNCGHYSGAQLVEILKFLTGIDNRVKTGQLDTKIMIDYMLLSILSCKG